jgi:hypothetical protein
LKEMGFSKESNSRNPAALLDGGTFFRLSDSSASRVGTRFLRFCDGTSTPMAGSSELCESGYTLNSGRTVDASDVWPVIIAAPLVPSLRGIALNGPKGKTFAPASQRSRRLIRGKLLWLRRALGTALPHRTGHAVAAHSKRLAPVFAG